MLKIFFFFRIIWGDFITRRKEFFNGLNWNIRYWNDINFVYYVTWLIIFIKNEVLLRRLLYIEKMNTIFIGLLIGIVRTI